MMMFSFSDSFHEYGLKNKTTSIEKIQKVLSFLSLNKLGIYLRDGCFRTDTGIVNLLSSKATHWVINKNETYFDSYGCSPPKKTI